MDESWIYGGDPPSERRSPAPMPEVGDVVFAPRAGMDGRRGLARVLRVLNGVAPVEVEYVSDGRRVWVDAKQIAAVDVATAIALAGEESP